jgi:transcriptional regulator with XRE-family HTH domain
MLSKQIAHPTVLEVGVSASTLLRSARHAGNLSQRALAELADTSGPTVAAYETGSKDPRTSTLLRLLSAAGMDVQVVARRPRADRFRDLLAAAIAEKIVADPALLDRALEVMDRGVWSSDYEVQWRALVAAGPAAVIGVLTSPHPDTLALKADSPFTMLGLVDDAERQRLLEAAYAT